MQQTSGPIQIVRYYDPAIDDSDGGAARARYAYERDITGVAFKAEPLPLIFVCKKLTVAQQRIVGALTAASDQYERAFAFGVVEVLNFPGPNGAATWINKSHESGRPMADEDAERFGWADRQEIGSVIRATSFLALGARLFLPPLASSQDALTMVHYQSAARMRDSETGTTEPSR